MRLIVPVSHRNSPAIFMVPEFYLKQETDFIVQTNEYF
jgi:hypothetical protein